MKIFSFSTKLIQDFWLIESTQLMIFQFLTCLAINIQNKIEKMHKMVTQSNSSLLFETNGPKKKQQKSVLADPYHTVNISTPYTYWKIINRGTPFAL